MNNVTAEDYAARLRLLRYLQGMLCHRRSAMVLDDEGVDKISGLVQILYEATPITKRDLHDFGKAGAADLDVVYCEEKGKPVFALKKSTAQ